MTNSKIDGAITKQEVDNMVIISHCKYHDVRESFLRCGQCWNDMKNRHDKMLEFIKNILNGKVGYFNSIDDDAEKLLKEIGLL